MFVKLAADQRADREAKSSAYWHEPRNYGEPGLETRRMTIAVG